jgi:molybdenum cofactor sulfurtransferase
MTMDSPAISLSSMQLAQETFRQKYPTFESTHSLDELRSTDYARLDQKQQVYLDYTGGGLYAESQLRQHIELLSHNIFGNPHSTNPTSAAFADVYRFLQFVQSFVDR